MIRITGSTTGSEKRHIAIMLLWGSVIALTSAVGKNGESGLFAAEQWNRTLPSQAAVKDEKRNYRTRKSAKATRQIRRIAPIDVLANWEAAEFATEYPANRKPRNDVRFHVQLAEFSDPKHSGATGNRPTFSIRSVQENSRLPFLKRRTPPISAKTPLNQDAAPTLEEDEDDLLLLADDEVIATDSDDPLLQESLTDSETNEATSSQTIQTPRTPKIIDDEDLLLDEGDSTANEPETSDQGGEQLNGADDDLLIDENDTLNSSHNDPLLLDASDDAELVHEPATSTDVPHNDNLLPLDRNNRRIERGSEDAPQKSPRRQIERLPDLDSEIDESPSHKSPSQESVPAHSDSHDVQDANKQAFSRRNIDADQTTIGQNFAPHDCLAGAVEYDPTVFSDDPDYSHLHHLPEVEMDIYDGKYLNPNERPWVELGRGNYLPGEIPPSETWLGRKNLISQHFLLYGDYRTGLAYNQNGGSDDVRWAHRLNLELDWKLTATERIHAFIGPLDRGNAFTHWQYEDNDVRFNEEFDDDFDTIFFEGDLGSLYGGFTDVDPPFDLPFAVGLVPLLYQNGYWMNDAMVGGVITLPAKYIEKLNWTNYDLTFFFGVNEVDSPAFGLDDSVADVFGVHAAIDALEGYLEVGYAFLHDEQIPERSYHNVGISFSKRYFHRVSNAIRLILNSGQDSFGGTRSANGQLVIFENAFISSDPNYLVPYMNLWAGFGTPQGVARAIGGNLQNIGISFETDGLTGYPLLDDTGNNTYGGAIGLNMLAEDFAEQLIVEFAWVNTHGAGFNRRAVADQYGFQARYQRPLTNAWLIRFDAMHGIFEEAEDVSGLRMELRYKF